MKKLFHHWRFLSQLFRVGFLKSVMHPLQDGVLIKLFVLLFFISLQSVSFESWAGSGQIVPAAPNGFGIRGVMNFSVNFRYVPTPADVTRLRNALTDANNIICDATDGQIVFGNVTINAGTVNEDQADIWIFPQPGRSNVNFNFNGSGFGNLGSHINLFQSGIDGEVIAHELGHLALGLGDEYDEQCRFGGPCGIGPGFDAGTINGQNNSLMQQSNIDATEFTVAANHDLLRGNGAACPAANTCGTPNNCTGTACAAFNSTTNRYESTQQTMIHGGDSDWQTIADNYPGLGIVIPALPTAAQPGNCGAFLNFIETVNSTNLVCLIMDRSGSMTIEDASDTTRMEFAKAAARAFVDVSLGLGSNYELGLVSFNHESTVNQSVQLLNAGSATTIKNTINGLVAGGNTAIGDGLISGAFELVGHAGANPTLFLLSDGQNNAGTNPADATNLLESRGIRVFTVPVGNGADRPLLSDIASATGGVMMDASGGDELPPIYMEMAAIHGGHSLVLPRTRFAVKAREIIIGRVDSMPVQPDKLTQTYPVNVETNAKSLILFLSNRNPEVNTWAPFFRIIGPNGEVITPNSQPFIGFDKYYQIVKVPNPTPGTWTVELSSAGFYNTYGHVLAFVENPTPDLFADANPRIANDTSVVTISAQAAYVADLDSGVTYQGHVITPTGGIVPLTFEKDEQTRTISAKFNSWNGRGIYEASIKAVSGPNAKVIPGEIIFEGPEDPGIITQPFERVATAAFFLDSPNFPPPSTDDSDNDGIPNDVENNQTPDPDNDNIPNPFDEDSDNDDIPDEEEGVNDDNNNGVPDFVDPLPGQCRQEEGKLNIITDSVKAPYCNKANGSIYVSVENATGELTYKWLHDATLNGPVAQNLKDGVYSVTVTDHSGCSDTQVFNLVQDCSSKIIVNGNCGETLVEGCKWKFRLTLDMNLSPVPNNKLGSFTGKISWNPAQLTPEGSPSLLNGYNGLFKIDEAAGTLNFNGVNSAGMEGLVDILENAFIIKAAAGENISIHVEFSAMAAANTFADLTPIVLYNLCNGTVIAGGLLGDINGDTKINSTDALIAMSHDVGKLIPANIASRITQGFGDVNTDGLTNSVDALIILTYELGYPVPYPIGEPFCPNGKSGSYRLAKSLGDAKVDVSAVATINPTDELLFDIPVVFNMDGTKEGLGSFKTTIQWNPEEVELISFEGGKTAGFAFPVVNEDNVDNGKLVVANANPEGGYGLVNVLNLHFKKRTTESKAKVAVDVTSLAAAKTFANLSANVITSLEAGGEVLINDLIVYPNPFDKNANVFFQVKDAGPVEVSLYNALGEKIISLFNENVESGKFSKELDAASLHLVPGIYVLKLKTESSALEQKISIMK